MSDQQPGAATDAVRGASTVDAARVSVPWYQSRPVIGASVIALGLAVVYGFKFLGASAPEDKPRELPPPPAKTQIRITEPAPPMPPPVPPAVVRTTPATQPPTRPPADEPGFAAPVMAISTQGTQRPPPPSAAAPPRPEQGISASMVGSRIVQVQAAASGSGTYRVSAGKPIACIMDTAMDTTISGFMTCHLDRDLYTDNNALVALDAGTVVFGEYLANLKQGQERIGVIWTRARTPKGITIDLNSPGSDALGKAGMGGEIETYFWTRYGTALAFSLIQDAGSAARQMLINSTLPSGNNNVTVSPSTAGMNTQNSNEQAIGAAMRNAANIPPILIKKQGTRVNILLRNDLDFSKVYRLEMGPQ